MATKHPLPWTIREMAESFVIEDASGQALAYVYFAEPARARAANRMERDDAIQIATWIARSPDLWGNMSGTEKAAQLARTLEMGLDVEDER